MHLEFSGLLVVLLGGLSRQWYFVRISSQPHTILAWEGIRTRVSWLKAHCWRGQKGFREIFHSCACRNEAEVTTGYKILYIIPFLDMY